MKLLAAALASLGLATAGCGGTSPPAATLSNAAGGAAETTPSGVSDGALWTCTILDYPSQPCRFAREGERWTLRKLLGSQRFRGVVTFAPDGGIDFDGERFCPWGDCTAPVQATFAPQGAGRYATLFDGEPVRLEWDPDNAREYGGAGYGSLTGDETRD